MNEMYIICSRLVLVIINKIEMKNPMQHMHYNYSFVYGH